MATEESFSIKYVVLTKEAANSIDINDRRQIRKLKLYDDLDEAELECVVKNMRHPEYKYAVYAFWYKNWGSIKERKKMKTKINDNIHLKKLMKIVDKCTDDINQYILNNQLIPVTYYNGHYNIIPMHPFIINDNKVMIDEAESKYEFFCELVRNIFSPISHYLQKVSKIELKLLTNNDRNEFNIKRLKNTLNQLENYMEYHKKEIKTTSKRLKNIQKQLKQLGKQKKEDEKEET